LDHNETTKHPIALSFSDISVWCYPCNSYIDNEMFEEARKAVMKDKFADDVCDH
jgi:histone deacetylase 6